MEQCSVLIEDGLVSDVLSKKRFEQKHFPAYTSILDTRGAFIAPGFIDTHIHGIGGYGTDDACAESVIEMSRILPRYGVSAFNPTLYSMESGALLEAVRNISAAIGKEPGARIMGLHLEGPFLAPDHPGARQPETCKPADIPYMEKLWEASGGRIVNMTIAPEIKGMRELARACIEKGIILQAGHTNADYESMVEGMEEGILHSTHLFFAMSKLDYHNPNAVGAVLLHPEMSCEIIADGYHVHQGLYKLLLRDKPIDKIVLVTGGQKPAIPTMIRGIKNLEASGFSLEDAVKTACFNPAQVMRYQGKGVIIPGSDADIVVFDRNYDVRAVLVEGKLKYNLL
jgi:N-acetylglucosamine-6-phosphate deacetylase